ncbi:cancer-related nucleoside-triphosphatase homolog [Nilaparvata lugens]|uniref:cancer-related nucleoside-triphosphatase homolog n=1 Tax=Nilaparvata lugens TaxID=108931 RepID=UPI00193CA44D|nr:cancer-related nucleoside-triphosphatase homolog [Nilaparvata lugens]
MDKLTDKLKSPTIRQILLTGSPGVGKTTLVAGVCSVLSNSQISLKGFYTQESRIGSSRVGFDVITVDKQHQGTLARKFQGNSAQRKPRVGPYEVDLASFESVALPALKKGSLSENKNSVMIIDEIGKMEMFSRQFENLVREIFKDDSCIVLATVPSMARLPLVESLKALDSSFLVEVTRENRDELSACLAHALKTKLETGKK